MPELPFWLSSSLLPATCLFLVCHVVLLAARAQLPAEGSLPLLLFLFAASGRATTLQVFLMPSGTAVTAMVALSLLVLLLAEQQVHAGCCMVLAAWVDMSKSFAEAGPSQQQLHVAQGQLCTS